MVQGRPANKITCVGTNDAGIKQWASLKRIWLVFLATMRWECSYQAAPNILAWLVVAFTEEALSFYKSRRKKCGHWCHTGSVPFLVRFNEFAHLLQLRFGPQNTGATTSKTSGVNIRKKRNTQKTPNVCQDKQTHSRAPSRETAIITIREPTTLPTRSNIRKIVHEGARACARNIFSFVCEAYSSVLSGTKKLFIRLDDRGLCALQSCEFRKPAAAGAKGGKNHGNREFKGKKPSCLQHINSVLVRAHSSKLQCS